VVIVILVSNTLLPRSLMGVRPLGAVVGASFGLVAAALGAVFTSGSGATSTVVLGGAVLVLATPLGWVFARRAVQPGVWSAFTAAIGITAVAVPLGAIGIGALMALGADNLTASEAFGGVLFVTIVGLLLFGLPLAGLTFVVASLWVGVLRLVVGWRGRAHDSDAPAGAR